MAHVINDDGELRQSMFNSLRTISNTVLRNLGYGWVDYPWEIIDQLQSDLEHAEGSLNLNEQGAQVNQLRAAITAIDEWNSALIRLDNTSNIPDESEHNWDID